MNLIDLGLTNEITEYLTDNNLYDLTVGRVTQEHRERYIISTGDNEYEAEITGNLREQEHSQTTEAEKRKKDREFGRMYKNVMKEKK